MKKAEITRLRILMLFLICLALPGELHAYFGQQQIQMGADPKAAPDGKWAYYALVIGNDDYQFLPKLQTATSDARAMARVLKDEYGFSTSLLLNASRADILEALVTFRRKLPVNSSLIIYYAGHGIADDEAKVAYWLPVDARSANNANWISADDVTAELRVIKAAHVLVIADSCYSGALMRSADVVDVNAEIKPQERHFYIEKVQQTKSRNVMASGGNEPVSDSGGGGHSIFAAVLLQSLRDIDDREYTGGSLFQKVAVRVAGRSQQTPQYSGITNSEHDGGDFVFMRQPGSTPPPDVCCDARVEPTQLPNSHVSRGLSENIEDILSRYRTAYEDEDISELQLLWPSMKRDAAKNLDMFFKQAKSVQLHTTIVGTPIITDSAATITVMEDLSYISDGKPRKVSAQKATFKLTRETGDRGNTGWKIESIQ